MIFDDDDDDGQMIFEYLEGLKLSDICLTGEEKPRKTLTLETCHDRGSNPGPLRDRRACHRLTHSGGRNVWSFPTGLSLFVTKTNKKLREMENLNIGLLKNCDF